MEFYERKDSNNYGVYDEGTFNKELTKSFVWMFIGLILSAITAYFIGTSVLPVYPSSIGTVTLLCAILELVLVFVLSRFISRMRHITAVITFMGYSILNGVSLSAIFLIFDIGSIITAFVLSAVFFACMALYGFATKKDLSRLGGMLFAGLISVVVLNLFNLFFKSSGLDLVLAYIGVALFLGITAFDIQRIKYMYSSSGLVHENMAIYAALMIYLDFINIFIEIIKIIGRTRLGDDN